MRQSTVSGISFVVVGQPLADGKGVSNPRPTKGVGERQSRQKAGGDCTYPSEQRHHPTAKLGTRCERHCYPLGWEIINAKEYPLKDSRGPRWENLSDCCR